MNILGLIGIAACIAGCSCLYLASPNQSWRTQPLPAVPVAAGPESAWRNEGAAPGAVSIASLVDPFARHM